MAETDANSLSGPGKDEEAIETTGKDNSTEAIAEVGGAEGRSEVLQPQKPQSQPEQPPQRIIPSRPHPSVISEFDPFASTDSSFMSKPGSSSEPKTPVPSKAMSRAQQLIPSADIQETPSESTSDSAVSQAPRKQAQKTQHSSAQAVSESETASPSAACQTQNRTGATSIADHEHRHAGSLLSEGESRTNPKPKEMAFDFQGFLAQLRSRQAEPIQKYLKR